ncbi:MAG TPA: Gfo/Idh/MocA family oxidoreductase [Myxococcaceae bacterium]|nr:Gfo/Idh/MocA family oxidoreductase [Myxococcaceae bacterium]
MAATKQKVARPRLGFLGVGWIGRHRMEAIARSELAEVVVVADPSEQACEEAVKVAPKCQRVGSYEELLEAPLDGVVIATPSAEHAEQAVRALERGLAVFCQKPLGRTEEEVRRVVDAARAADRLLGVDLSYRHTVGMQELRKHIRGGALGEVFAMELVFHNAYGPDKPWFYEPKLSGGGCVMDLGIHLVDLALWVLDFPEVKGVESRLYAGGRPVRGRGGQVEDYAVAQVELGSGVLARLACSWKLNAGSDALIEASFYGTKGGGALRNVNGSFYDFTAELFHGTKRERLAEPPDAWGGRAGVDWAKRLAAGERFDPEAERLVEVARLLDRIYC